VLPQIVPAKLARSLAAFNDPDWLFELKHDGFRSLAYIENGQCRLVSRYRNTYKSFETLSHDLARLRVENAILDGEIVCLDSNGHGQFKELLYRRGRTVFFAFDLVWLNDTDLRKIPLIERRKKLKRLIERGQCFEIIYAQHVERDGKLLLKRFASETLKGLCASGNPTSTQSMDGWKSRTRTIPKPKVVNEMVYGISRASSHENER
jgi:bifunctional non-homologous end joining protein LigD